MSSVELATVVRVLVRRVSWSVASPPRATTDDVTLQAIGLGVLFVLGVYIPSLVLSFARILKAEVSKHCGEHSKAVVAAYGDVVKN